MTFEGLTATEARVAGLLARGYANSEITAELAMPEERLEHHLADVYRKLGVRSRTELAYLLLADSGSEGPSSNSADRGNS